MVQGNYAAAMAWFRPEREALEAEFRARVEQVVALPGAEGTKARREVAEQCWRDAAAAEAGWIARAGALSCSAIRPTYRRAWTRFDKLAAD
jgi:hypothetical protein